MVSCFLAVALAAVLTHSQKLQVIERKVSILPTLSVRLFVL